MPNFSFKGEILENVTTYEYFGVAIHKNGKHTLWQDVQVYKLIHGIDCIKNMENLLQNLLVKPEDIFIKWSNHVAAQTEGIRVSSIES